MLKLTRKVGSEGGTFDPYSYDEITVRREHKVVTAHIGCLVMWLDVNGERTSYTYDEEYEALVEKFKAETGMTVDEFMRYHDRIQYPPRCPKCFSKKQRECANGFPGESFELCSDCGHAVTYHFSESAII